MYVPTPNGGPILRAYSNHFSRVWVVLSPFLKPRAIPFARFWSDTYPTRNEILADCEPVTWSEVLRKGRFDSLSDIDVALRSYIHGLKPPSQRLKDKLVDMIEEHKIIPPTEGHFAPHNERKVLMHLKDLGHSHMIVYDEFGEQKKRITVKRMLAEDIVPLHGVISTEDNSILIGSHWDSHCSFLCTQICDDQFSNLEKFLCSNQTEVFWGLHPV